MIVIDRKVMLKAFVLVAVLLVVQCYENNSDLMKAIKRGIILRCQGNPVSCYGKRSFNDEQISSPALDSEIETASQEKQEMLYEKYAENLIKSCRLGNNKDCNKILRIMLMNNPN